MTNDQASFVTRLLPLTGLILTSAAAISLFAIRSDRYGGTIVNTVRENRATIQLIVQAVSGGLALLQVYVLRTLFNFATRLRLNHERITMQRYALWSAGSQLTVDWSLRNTSLAWLLLAVISAAIPAALWAGALTPVDSHVVQFRSLINLPAFTTTSAQVWDTEFFHHPNDEIWNMVDTCRLSHNGSVFVPSCPAPALQGQLLQSASTATTNHPAKTRVHAKHDNSQWSYCGRSFGVGVSAGLALPQSPETLAYSYHEAGYDAAVTCFRNTSSLVHFNYDPNSPVDFPVYRLIGPLSIVPPNITENYPVSNWYGDYERLLAWKARSYNGKNLISIASGKYNYTQFDHIECDVSFQPTVFEVAVNMSSQQIMVHPTANDAVDMEPQGHLKLNVIQTINLLSRMSNSNYVSIRGDALQLNHDNMKQRRGVDDETTVTSAVAESFTAIIDDVLVAYGASQIVLAQDTKQTQATVSYSAIRIGNPVYVYLTFSLNTLVILIVLIEAGRSKFWEGLLAFDYTNVKCAILAASAGGTSIADKVAEWNRKEEIEWDGGSADKAFGHVDVTLSTTDSKPRLVCESGHSAAPALCISSPIPPVDRSPSVELRQLGRGHSTRRGYVQLSDP